jgi:hypothetical protein
VAVSIRKHVAILQERLAAMTNARAAFQPSALLAVSEDANVIINAHAY